jgi:uncharacterized delta-60 repeat protein
MQSSWLETEQAAYQSAIEHKSNRPDSISEFIKQSSQEVNAMKHFFLSTKRIKYIHRAAIAAILVCNILPGPAKAASGDLDASFGIEGKLVHDVSSSLSDLGLALGAMVTQPDGKILMAGSVRSLFVLARYNPNGTIDTSFGVNGVSEVSGFRGSDLDLMDDGRIVAAGTVLTPGNFDFEVVRFNPDGSLDSTFGNGGRTFTDLSGMRDDGRAVSVTSDGKIVVAGFSSGPSGGLNFALARYSSDGTLDTSFGNGGKVITDFSGFPETISELAIQKDGKYVAVGETESFARVIEDPECGCPVTILRIDFAIARYNVDGSLDSGFGNGGKVAIQVTNPATDNASLARSVAIQRDGKIVVAGIADGFGVVRLNKGGSLDSSFGINGKVNTTFFVQGPGDRANAVMLEPDGKIIVAGRVDTGRADTDFGVAQYERDGTLDTSFGVEGKIATDFGNSIDDARSLARSRGRILVGGFTTSSTAFPPGAAFAIARYRPH